MNIIRNTVSFSPKATDGVMLLLRDTGAKPSVDYDNWSKEQRKCSVGPIDWTTIIVIAISLLFCLRSSLQQSDTGGSRSVYSGSGGW